MRLLILLGLVLPAMSRKISPFIVGGSDTDISNHPHQLSLRVDNSHSCGASLISETRAVTAAHCLGLGITRYSLLGGSTDYTVTTCSTCELWDPTAYTRHPEYSGSGARGYPNDVAVIDFSPVTLNSNIRPITMATPTDGDFAGQSCTITGWGLTSGGGSLSMVLQEATMTAMTNADCIQDWSATQINDGHICFEAPSSSACNGDSGGPSVCSGLLSGATSWGVSSCEPSYPSVYTRISYFYDWINEQ